MILLSPRLSQVWLQTGHAVSLFCILQVLGRGDVAAQDMACQFCLRIKEGFPQKTPEGLTGEGGPQGTPLPVSAPLESCRAPSPALWLHFPALLYRSCFFASSSTHAPKIASPACPSHPDCPTPASASTSTSASASASASAPASLSAPQGLPGTGSQNGKLLREGI